MLRVNILNAKQEYRMSVQGTKQLYFPKEPLIKARPKFELMLMANRAKRSVKRPLVQFVPFTAQRHSCEQETL